MKGVLIMLQKINNKKDYIKGTIFCLLLFVLSFMFLKVTPFGENTICVWDCNIQYICLPPWVLQHQAGKPPSSQSLPAVSFHSSFSSFFEKEYVITAPYVVQ